jgi:hypothetical protein
MTNQHARILGAFVGFFATVEVAALLLGLLELRMSAPLATGLLVLGGLVGWRLFLHFDGGTTPDRRLDSNPISRFILRVLIAGGWLWYAYLLVIALLARDLSCDGNAYHLPPINAWAVAGYIHWIDFFPRFTPLFNGYPKAIEVFGFVLSQATGSSAALHGLNLFFMPLGIFGIAALSRRLGASAAASMVAGLGYLCVPVNIFQAPTLYVDSAYASAAIATLASFAVAGGGLVTTARAPLGRRAWTLAVLTGGSAGLALGAKASALVLVFACLLWLGAAFAADARFQPHRLRRAAPLVGAVTAIALLVGGYWYVRNFVKEQSPVYPVGVSLGQHVLFPGVSIHDSIGEEANTPRPLRSLSPVARVESTWSQRPWPSSIMGYDARLGGLGFLWLYACLPAVAAAAVVLFRREGERAIFVGLLVVTMAAFLTTPMNWWARYTIWLYGLGLPCLAVIIDAATRSVPGERLWARLAIAGWLSCVAWFAMRETRVAFVGMIRSEYPSTWDGDFLGLLRPSGWRRPENDLFPQTRGSILDEVIATPCTVAIEGPLSGELEGRLKHNLLGALSRPVGRHRLVPVSHSLPALHREGVRYIVADDAEPISNELSAVAARIEHPRGFWVVVVK